MVLRNSFLLVGVVLVFFLVIGGAVRFFYHVGEESYISDEEFYLNQPLNSLQKQIPPDVDWEPGSTSWSSVEIEGLIGADVRSLEEIDSKLRETQPGITENHFHRTAYRQLETNLIEYLIQLWGFKDDSVAGADYRIIIDEGDKLYRIKSVENRHHCRRGVTENNLCL